MFCVLGSAFVSILPSDAGAQTPASGFTGFATGFIGLARGGDVVNVSWTPGGSVAVVEGSGLGAELDVSHVSSFNKARFVQSGVTSLTINMAGVWPDVTALVRPYVVGGVGLLRARACISECQVAVTRTDWAFDAGGGVFVLLNESIGARGDVRYFRYFQRHIDLPLTDNGFFDFWRASIGVTVSWPIR